MDRDIVIIVDKSHLCLCHGKKLNVHKYLSAVEICVDHRLDIPVNKRFS